MSRINIKALMDSMVAKGYPDLASVVQDSFGSNSEKPSTDSKSLENEADDEVDEEALRDTVLREFKNRIDDLKLTTLDSIGAEAPELLEEALLKLTEEPDTCRNCQQSLDRLSSTGESNVFVSCLDHMLPMLECLSLEATLRKLIDAVRHQITGLQILDLYLSAQNPKLSRALYDTLLEKTDVYATFVPEFCSLLPFDLFRKLLDDDDLNVSSEDDVLNLIKQRRSTNTDGLRELLSCIRYPFLTCSTYDALADAHPETLICPEYELCKKSKEWLSQLTRKQLSRRRHYSNHFHILWHEDSVGLDDWEKLAVSCLKGSHDEDILCATITEELESVVEARGRCAVSGRKALVGASSGSEVWVWSIDTSSTELLASPEERSLSPTIKDAEFVDASDAGDGEVLVSWLREPDEEYCLGILDLNVDDNYSCDRVGIPPVHGSCRSRLYKNFVILLSRTHMTLFDKVARTSLVFDSPAKSFSFFLDLIVIPVSQGKNRIYVHDCRTVVDGESAARTFRDVLLVFDLDRLEWEEDSWELELGSANTDLRRHPGPYNGISLFEYRRQPGILAEMSERGGVRFRIILVHDSEDDQWTETVADISAVKDGGLGVREILGFVPTDLNPCAHETVLSRYCRKNPTSSQLLELRKLAE